MKKSIIIMLSVVLLLLLVLFCPFSISQYDDGGTCEYRALTYKVVKWNRNIATVNKDGKGGSVFTYKNTTTYWYPDNIKSIDELWEMENAPIVGQSITKGKGTLLKDVEVSSISISSLPEGQEYSFSGDDAKAIVDYLSSLTLFSDFEENPDEYGGMTWTITIEYDRGYPTTIYHFGNMFIKTEDGTWYKMVADEANRFDGLLNRLNA